MSKRSLYTIVTPLPPTVSRETAVQVLHSHSEMIQLNPLVINHVKCKPPPNASADEFHCIWYELTDKVTYLPGVKGTVNYKACFHDLPRSLQTHVYAPAGLEIKEKWSIGGNEPHEEREVIEIGMAGLGVPREGLYLREDVDMRCNVFLTNFVKKTLKRAHQVLVERLVYKADLEDDTKVRSMYTGSMRSPRSSHMAYSLRDAPLSSSASTLRRGDSVRSDGTSGDATSTLARSEMQGQSYIAELPVGLGLGMKGAAATPLKSSSTSKSRRDSFDQPSHAGQRAPNANGGTVRVRHPSNAFGLAPTEPVELE